MGKLYIDMDGDRMISKIHGQGTSTYPLKEYIDFACARDFE